MIGRLLARLIDRAYRTLDTHLADVDDQPPTPQTPPGGCESGGRESRPAAGRALSLAAGLLRVIHP